MKILVIRYKEIGDVLLTSVLCKSLKKSFPDSEVDYLIYAGGEPLFEYHPYINKVITIDKRERKNPFRYLRKVFSIRRNKYDIIVDTTSTAKSEIISFFSNSTTYRIGRFKQGRGRFYTHRLKTDELTGNKIDQRISMLQPLRDAGIEVVIDDKLELTVVDSERIDMRNVMLRHGIDFDRPVLAFSVSSKLPEKKWREEYMLEIMQYCLDQHEVQIVLFGGMPHEMAAIEKFHEKMGWHRDIFSDIPSKSLRSLLPLFANCDMFVGNEGGPRHMSHAVGIPTVSIFAPCAEREEWLVGDSDRHQGISWRDIPDNRELLALHVPHDDETYYRLYNSITPAAVIPLIDHVIQKHVILSNSSDLTN